MFSGLREKLEGTLLLGIITADRRKQISADSYDVVPTERISLIVLKINGCYRRLVRRQTVFWKKQYKQRINMDFQNIVQWNCYNEMCA